LGQAPITGELTLQAPIRLPDTPTKDIEIMTTHNKINTLRVAAAQFASTLDVAENLATCLRMIDQAAECKPQVIVLPEFCNALSWYDDQDHAWRVAVDIDGDFLRAIGEKARQHQCYIDINVTVRRANQKITVTSVLVNPQGHIEREADKQTLMGHENFFFARAEKITEVVDAPFGKLGIFPCRDGVTFETPRSLTLRGAQLFCDSLNSFALDEATLHVPARAPENKVFLISANKTGPLIPEGLLESVSAATHIPVEFLMGAGGSQIVKPDGTVIARGPVNKEAVIWGDIDLSEADNKLRPDGTHILNTRRPELYKVITIPPAETPYCASNAADHIKAAVIAPGAQGEAVIGELFITLSRLPVEVKLAVLPELFCFENGLIENINEAIGRSQRAIATLQMICATRDLTICTTLVEGSADKPQHVGVLINKDGVIFRQPQLHRVERHAWNTLGDAIETVDLTWGRVAILTGDDAIYPEVAKVAALKGAHVLLAPFDLQEKWEVEFGLPSRAAENRVCIVACTRPKAFGSGLIATLERDFTILTEWKERKFDGYINNPLITTQDAKNPQTIATIHPNAASNKLMSANTDLLADRPWFLSGEIIKR
jgi:predicted amidohydrolase